MTTVKKNLAPFGSSAKRFGKFTAHPGLNPQGFLNPKPRGCDPCLYKPQPLHKIFEVNRYRKVDKDPWRYKAELEAWSKNLGYRNQRVLEQRKWQKSLLGPAWTTVPEPVKHESVCENLSFGRTPRFKPIRSTTPGPGTYYKAVPFKAPYGPHSSRPTLEREEPCRFKDTIPKWSLAPNRYAIIDKECIEEKSKKIVSIRGPYDLFTGKRDGSSIKNHFNTSLKVSATTWPLALPGSLEKYKKMQFGKLNKTGRSKPSRGRLTLADLAMCPKKPSDPSPAHYVVDKPKEFKQNKRGFNSSYSQPPGYVRVVVWPGVGRYNPRRISCGIPGHGHRHVFRSKIGRTIGAMIPEPMNSF